MGAPMDRTLVASTSVGGVELVAEPVELVVAALVAEPAEPAELVVVAALVAALAVALGRVGGSMGGGSIFTCIGGGVGCWRAEVDNSTKAPVVEEVCEGGWDDCSMV